MENRPFRPGDTIINRDRPLLAPMTVTHCAPHPGGWMVHYEIVYHPDCSPITGVIPAEMAEVVR